MASISIRCPSCSATEGVVRNGKRGVVRNGK
ncbi:IS1 family transposase, partial [Escherichia coli]